MAFLRQQIPSLSAIWVFGSHASGDAGPESDLDVATLADEPQDPVALWELSGELEDRLGVPVARAREEYREDPVGFADDFTRQDAAILNIQRACEAALDVGHHLVRRARI